MNTAVVKRPCNHPLHLIITLFTCGFWAPFWIAAAIAGRTETVVQQYPAPWAPQPRQVGHHGYRLDPPGAPPHGHVWNPYKGEWQ